MTLATGAAAGTGGSGLTLLILALPILFLLFLMFSQRRRARAVTDAQGQLQPGQEVMTTSGMYGVVRAIEDDVVHLEAGGTVFRFQRRAILPISMVGGGGPARGAAPESAPEPAPRDGDGDEEPRR
ncbi:preprotein translocase subunit YajC [uncultured Serinicoccus sp.]|uniref:preprotein translocase subunit YajC n=1 Tax=uncultured Serinicoccus sp. TaxID=735514 RepID=UPI00260FEEC1|nr:preprotein translocase subunit YajC [uncultured Serinicoccus sp.]